MPILMKSSVKGEAVRKTVAKASTHQAAKKNDQAGARQGLG
jgi:hypothetical protein